MNMYAKNNRIYLLVISLFLSNYIFGQEIYLTSGFLNDEIHTTDSLIYQYGIYTSAFGCIIVNRTIESKNDSIFLNTCTFEGNLSSPCDVFDTLLIAKNLSKGDYVLVHFSHLGSFAYPDDTLCQVWADDPISHDTAYYSFTVLPTTSTRELTGFNNVSLLPNPATSNIYLAFEIPLQSSFDVQIFDLSGHLQKQLILPATGNQGVDVSSLSPGIYFLKLMDGEGHSETLKFVKL